MVKLKSLLLFENSSYSGKTYICVDIQPEYQSYFRFQPSKFCEFLNENHESFSNLVFLYNGHETLGLTTKDDYKHWLLDNELNEDILNYAQFYDKGYAFFRYCMDNYVDESATVNFVRFMYNNDIRDSRDMTREMWAKYLREYRRLDRKEVYELLKHSGDCVNVPDLMDYLKEFRNIVLTGGGINECLKEVEIALQALNISYQTDNRFTY
jgi:hypothetical protein